MHSIHLTHTDLKPENILLSVAIEKGESLPSLPEVALIDFGGATWHKDHHSSVVCTRQYRPPEVTLGLEWSYPVDLWSMGCILAELWTGCLLFSTHDEVEVSAHSHALLLASVPSSLSLHILAYVFSPTRPSHRTRAPVPSAAHPTPFCVAS